MMFHHILIVSTNFIFFVALKFGVEKDFNTIGPLLNPLANIGIFPGVFLGISMESGANWLERWIFLKGFGISQRVSWISISQASYHHFP